MDVLRRNTDYALRAMVALAARFGGKPASTRYLAKSEDVPYQLACKLLQKLHRAGLADSIMGPQGGFYLSRAPGEISVLEVVEAIQGPISLNRCVLGVGACPREDNCPISERLIELQRQINEYLGGLDLDELLRHKKRKTKLRARANR